jgi:GGDEF domain-containing protein
VILPDTNADQAQMFCLKLCRTLENDALFKATGIPQGLRFSVSAGIAEAHQDSHLKSLLTAAESAQNIFFECTI